MNEPLTVRVIIADDHPIVRDGLTTILDADPQFKVVADVGSFKELTEILHNVSADVLVLDIGGMGSSPLLTIERLRRDYPKLPIVVFSSSIDMVPEMLAAGVQGYMVKEERTLQLIPALRAVHRGQHFLSPLAKEYVARYTAQSAKLRLAPMEVTVLKLMTQGLSTEEIADHRGIDSRTIHNHIYKLRRKIGVHQRTELVNWYRRVFGSPGSSG